MYLLLVNMEILTTDNLRGAKVYRKIYIFVTVQVSILENRYRKYLLQIICEMYKYIGTYIHSLQ